MPRPEDTNWKAPKPRTPAPQVDPVFIWPTPEVRDFLFFVERNGDLPKNQTFQYGDAYPDPLKYPNHKLVHVSPQTLDKWSRWYYMAERVDQDEHNFSFSNTEINGVRLKSVVREYATLRSVFDPEDPAIGATMPDVPRDKFTGTYVLYKKEETPHPEEVINGLFVFERHTYILADAFGDYLMKYPVKVSMNLPRELLSVSVDWNENVSEGNQNADSFNFITGASRRSSISLPDDATSSASLSPEIFIKYKDFATENLYGEKTVFYMQSPVTQATVMARLEALTGNPVAFWPVFKPESQTIAARGQSLQIRVDVNASISTTYSTSTQARAWTKNQGDSSATANNTNQVQIPPCIHGEITITGDTTKTLPVSAVALSSVYSDDTNLGYTSVVASASKVGSVTGSVSPTTLPATSPSSVPTTGLYIIDMDVADPEFGWHKVVAIVFDASDLA